MKITRGETTEFEPITIVLETEKEAALFKLIIEYPNTVSEAIVKIAYALDKDKIIEVLDNLEVRAKFEDFGVTTDLFKKHFKK